MIMQNLAVPREMLAIALKHLDDTCVDVDFATRLSLINECYAATQAVLSKPHEKPLWQPINELQTLALATPAFELFCGGRARTGKSDLILGAAIASEHKNSIIFRPEYTQIRELRNRSREILRGTGASYNGQDHEWKNIPGNRTLEFGALKNDGDENKYFGRPHDLICFDEITKFKEEHYRTVWAWAVPSGDNPDQRVRIICTGNPPTHPRELWVKQRWAAWVDEKHPNPAKPGELRWYVNLNGQDTEVEKDAEVYDDTGKKLEPISRTFLPGELLHFLRGTPYEATLDALPEVKRRALRDGDFSAAEDDQARQVIPTSHVLLAFERWEQMPKPDTKLTGLGVDVARGGKDQTVISKRYGEWFDELIKYPASETPTGKEVADAVILSIVNDEHPKRKRIVLDLTGVGASPYDKLVEQNYSVDGFQGAEASPYMDAGGTHEFVNRRAEAWWTMRESLDPDSPRFANLALPPDSELLADLTAPTFDFRDDAILIESKDAIIKRLGRSPDAGDAVVMCWNSRLRSGENMVYF